jgi:hypothetical protein
VGGIDSIVHVTGTERERKIIVGTGSPAEGEDHVDDEDDKQDKQVAILLQQRVNAGSFLVLLGFMIDVIFFRWAGDDGCSAGFGLMGGGVGYGHGFYVAGGRCEFCQGMGINV